MNWEFYEAVARAMPMQRLAEAIRNLTPEQFAEMARLRGVMTVDAALVAACKMQETHS